MSVNSADCYVWLESSLGGWWSELCGTSQKLHFRFAARPVPTARNCNLGFVDEHAPLWVGRLLPHTSGVIGSMWSYLCTLIRVCLIEILIQLTSIFSPLFHHFNYHFRILLLQVRPILFLPFKKSINKIPTK